MRGAMHNACAHACSRLVCSVSADIPISNEHGILTPLPVGLCCTDYL